MSGHDYRFRSATTKDLALINRWQSQTHVSEWWDTEEEYDEEDLVDPQVSIFIVSTGGSDFAFMQDYAIHGFGDHHFDHLPEGSRGIDQFIGVKAMLGCGHGWAMIHQRMGTLFYAGTPVIATDPHPDNTRAIHVYQKLGFEIVGPPQKTPWGRILPMLASAKAFAQCPLV